MSVMCIRNVNQGYYLFLVVFVPPPVGLKKNKTITIIIIIVIIIIIIITVTIIIVITIIVVMESLPCDSGVLPQDPVETRAAHCILKLRNPRPGMPGRPLPGGRRV